MFKISLKKLDKMFLEISKSNTLYVPVNTKSGAEFKKWQQGMRISTDVNTNKSPKDFFFPQTQNLMDFKVKGKNIEIFPDKSNSESFIIFGVRACDVKSLEILDKVFLSNPVDAYYKRRRESGIIMSLACENPLETCFCHVFNIDASSPKGDVVCYKIDEFLYMNAATYKGENFLKEICEITECEDSAKVENQKKLIKDRIEKLPLTNVLTEKFKNASTKDFFDDPKWSELSRFCVGCGTCTFICPTCHCYDIKDFNSGCEIKRFRCWDSCMYSSFTKMSAGQPRATQTERFRQRFMHKLIYFPMNNDGDFSCVGCGRCALCCPIHMNIVKVMKTLGGGKTDA